MIGQRKSLRRVCSCFTYNVLHRILYIFSLHFFYRNVSSLSPLVFRTNVPTPRHPACLKLSIYLRRVKTITAEFSVSGLFLILTIVIAFVQVERCCTVIKMSTQLQLGYILALVLVIYGQSRFTFTDVFMQANSLKLFLINWMISRPQKVQHKTWFCIKITLIV